MTDRLTLAATDPRVVVSASGLLAEFNDAGVLDPLDVASAEAICRLLDEPDEQVALAAALTVRGTRHGHVCIRLDTIREAVVVDGLDPEDIEHLPWPDPDLWTQAVRQSPIVGTGGGPEPLILEDDRLYLERYHTYEARVAHHILSRTTDSADGISPRSGGGAQGLSPRGSGGSTAEGREGGLDTTNIEPVRPPQAAPTQPDGTSTHEGVETKGLFPRGSGGSAGEAGEGKGTSPRGSGGSTAEGREGGLDPTGIAPVISPQAAPTQPDGSATHEGEEAKGLSPRDSGGSTAEGREGGFDPTNTEPVRPPQAAPTSSATRPLTPSQHSTLDALLGTDASAQRTAAERAITGHFTVIAGGPGTGKTHTVGAIVAALAADGPDSFPSIAVAAPTGKAAARMAESINAIASRLDDPTMRKLVSTVEPSTIHRLLGWRWGRGRFVHDEDHRLPHDVVIVDEMSMVSLPMTAKLLRAVREDASVVLVGDPYQLESIEAGTVLTDIVSTVEQESPVADRIVVLERLHRFAPGGPVAEFAEAVRSGHADRAIELLSAGADQLRWIPRRSSPGFSEMWNRIVEIRSEAVHLAGDPADPEAALAALSRMAVLCARRQGENGVSVWGRDIESAVDQRFVGLRYGTQWYPGRPVMITSNDYRLELFNGDIGVTIETPDGPRLVFDRGGIRTYPVTRIGEHTTVHAMTIHKSQGSQFDEVVVVLPDEASRLLTRELLYTAVTRSTSTVSIVGDEDVLRRAIARSVERASGLASRIALRG